MDLPAHLYPLGEQEFAKIRTSARLYIDKTEYVYKLTHASSENIFLSRPRRFGKSLLVSTLQAYFEGRRELFESLAIENLEQEWEQYPVIRLDMSLAKHEEADALNRYLLHIVKLNEERFDIIGVGEDPNLRLTDLIASLNKKTGKQVVVLIDEYDSPLLDIIHEDANLPQLRKIMRNFYSPLKGCSQYLRFVFLTGITKFSQLSIFSELNNIRNISMLPEYAAICGITKEELLTQMSIDIDILAEKQNVSHETMVSMLIENYDGYHFTWPSPDIFNPYSLLHAFADGRIGAYWFDSGTPTHLIEMLRKYETLPSNLGKMELQASRFDAPTETMTTITPLLYQSGYITIKGYDSGLYTLDIPNNEIKVGLMESLLPYYVDKVDESSVVAVKMRNLIRRGNIGSALQLLQTFFETIPYADNASSEGHYQQVLVIIFRLLGFQSEVELHTKVGRIDIELKVDTAIYIIEIKTNAYASSALNQINAKAYAAKYALTDAIIYKVGINFNPEIRNMTDWLIEQV